MSDEHLLILKAHWKKAIENEGAHCPVCKRWGKIYGRSINKTMAYSLVWLTGARSDDDGWVDVPNSGNLRILRSNQLPTLRWWNLVERKNIESDKTKHAGLWRATPLGKDFVHGLVQVPEKVFTYDAEVVAFSDKQTHIWQCFKNQFDYQEIMNQMFPERQQSLF